MASIVKSLMSIVDKGRQGLNQGLGMGLPKLEEVMDGVQRETYSLICGGTGSGKTTFALYSYVYRPIADNLGSPKFRVIYISLEMRAEILIAKLWSIHLYEKYGVEIPYKQLISRTKGEHLSDEHYNLLIESEGYMEQFCKQLIIYDKPLSSTGLKNLLQDYSEKHGVYATEGNRIVYKPFVEDEIVEVVIDHFALLTLEPKQDRKMSIDSASGHLVHYRNTCRYSPLALLQLNRAANSMDRRKANMQEIELSDIKDSGSPAQDAELVLAIFHPWREKMATYGSVDGKYQIRYLKNCFRAIQVLKSRLGEADVSVAVNFFGTIGYWKELPPAEELQHLREEDYGPYTSLKPKEQKIKQEQKDVTFTFRFEE